MEWIGVEWVYSTFNPKIYCIFFFNPEQYRSMGKSQKEYCYARHLGILQTFHILYCCHCLESIQYVLCMFLFSPRSNRMKCHFQMKFNPVQPSNTRTVIRLFYYFFFVCKNIDNSTKSHAVNYLVYKILQLQFQVAQ